MLRFETCRKHVNMGHITRKQ